MLNTRYKSRAARTREMRENLSIIMASQRSKMIFPAAQKLPKTGIRRPLPGTIFSRTPTSEVPQTLAAARSRIQAGKFKQWHTSAFSTAPVVRIPSQNQSQRVQRVVTPGSSTPFNTPFLFKHVQRPTVPETPRSVQAQTGYPRSTLGILQSPWIRRGEPSEVQVKTTSQYSIKELIDILCGDAEEIPEELEPIGRRIQFTSEKDVENNQAIALGRSWRTPKRQKSSTKSSATLVPLPDNFANVSIFPKPAAKSTSKSIENELFDFSETGILDLSSTFDKNEGSLSTPIPKSNHNGLKSLWPLGTLEDLTNTKLLSKRKTLKVSFNDTVEISSGTSSSIFPKTPADQNLMKTFAPMWGSSPAKRSKETQKPSKNVTLRISDPVAGFDMGKDVVRIPIDKEVDHYFSPTKFTLEALEDRKENSVLKFYRRTSSAIAPTSVTALPATTPKPVEIVRPIDVDSWFPNNSCSNHFELPTNTVSISTPATFSQFDEDTSPHFNKTFGSGLDILRQNYHSDSSPSPNQPFSISW